MAPRDTYRYGLWRNGQLKAYGVTNDPERRLGEHVDKRGDVNMSVYGPRVTRKTALGWERNRIDGYRDRKGRLPPWNKV